MNIFQKAWRVFTNILNDIFGGIEDSRPMENRVNDVLAVHNENINRVINAIAKGGKALGIIPLHINRTKQSVAKAEAEYRTLAARYNRLANKATTSGTVADKRDALLVKAEMEGKQQEYVAYSESLKTFEQMLRDAREMGRMNLQNLSRYKLQISKDKMRGVMIVAMDASNQARAAIVNSQREVAGLMGEAGKVSASSSLDKLEEQVHGHSGSLTAESDAIKVMLDTELSAALDMDAPLDQVNVDDVLAKAKANVEAEEPTVLVEAKTE